MENPGLDDTSTPTALPKTYLVVILVVVLSILVLCLSGIALVIYYRRRWGGKKYLKLSPETLGTAVADNRSPPSPSAWNSFLQRIFPSPRSSPSNTYMPVPLHTAPPGHKIVPRLTPIPESSSTLQRPASRRNPTPNVAYNPRTPSSPNRNYTFPVPFVKQSVVRIAPLPDNSTPRAPPVRAPSTPIIVSSRGPSPSRPPIKVINIDRPSNFVIDPPSLSTPPLSVGNEHRRPSKHGQSHSDGYVVPRRQEPVRSARSPTRRSLSTTESDSILDTRFTRNDLHDSSSHPEDLRSPVSASSGSTSASNAGSSRPPTLTIQNLLRPVRLLNTRLPSLQAAKPLSTSLSSSGQRTPNQVPAPAKHGQYATHSESQSSHHAHSGESGQDRRLYPPKYSSDQNRRHPPPSSQGNDRNGARPMNQQRQGGLFPDVVVGAGYQTGRVPNPLPLGVSEPRGFALAPVPPPTPNSWALLHTDRT